MDEKKEMGMDLLNLLKERYSVRKFSDKKIESDKLDKILEAGKLAPTACNLQPQRLLVLDNDESLNKLKNCTPYHFDTKLAILVCYDKTVSWKRKYDNYDGGTIDASIVTTQMMLEITNLGLGTTWVGHFDPQKMIEEFEIPENLVPIALLPIGYPAEDVQPSPMHEKRLDLGQTVFYNKF